MKGREEKKKLEREGREGGREGGRAEEEAAATANVAKGSESRRRKKKVPGVPEKAEGCRGGAEAWLREAGGDRWPEVKKKKKKSPQDRRRRRRKQNSGSSGSAVSSPFLHRPRLGFVVASKSPQRDGPSGPERAAGGEGGGGGGGASPASKPPCQQPRGRHEARRGLGSGPGAKLGSSSSQPACRRRTVLSGGARLAPWRGGGLCKPPSPPPTM